MASLTLVLASGSPRRHHFLAEAGFRFDVLAPRVDESPLPGEAPDRLVLRLARAKARDVAGRLGESPVCVLGIDTVVVLDGDVLGKPRHQREAVAMLLRLSGRDHLVYSGFSVLTRLAERRGVEVTRVSMRDIAAEEASAYAATGEPLDKAGAYALQGDGRRFVSSVAGSAANVVGLPIEALVPVLAEIGVHPERPPSDWPIMGAEQRSAHR